MRPDCPKITELFRLAASTLARPALLMSDQPLMPA
jgi:hypothetical protein